MPRTAEEWHNRFLYQAAWTRRLRTHLLDHNLPHAINSILEVGSGTSAVLSEYAPGNVEIDQAPSCNHHCLGIDLDAEFLTFSNRKYPTIQVVQGDGRSLPLIENSFSATFCHYTLLWCEYPEIFLSELIRVTEKGGLVAAFAEPDYLGCIYYPDLLEEIKLAQIEELEASGADPGFGRKLPGLFRKSKLGDVHCGIYGYSRESKISTQSEKDLACYQIEDLEHVYDTKIVMKLRGIEYVAQQSMDYLKYIPTFYAWGIKKF